MKIPTGAVVIALFVAALLGMVWVPLSWFAFAPIAWHSEWWFGPMGYSFMLVYEAIIIGCIIKKIIDL
jgi:hypothetical protein